MKNNKKIKLFKTLLSITLILPFFTNFTTVEAAVGGNGYDEVNEAYEAGLSLQPLAPAFRLQTLMNWTPESDPDAELNRASIPINKDRFKGHQINELANPDAKITNAAIINYNHDESPSTGGSDFNIYAFNHWQYIDSLIYWAGTDEGIFAIPSPDIVDAAHKNGVPVYATLGFPWGPGHFDSLAELENMLEKAEDGSFPVADKMIEVAQYFGFDGYFFNQESYGSTESVANQLNEMLRYMRSKSREVGYPLNISWYDAMANSGNVSHQDAVNDKNDLWMRPAPEDNKIYAVDEFFMNYNWSYNNKISATHDHMKEIGRDPYDAYAGLEVQQNSYKTDILGEEGLLDENGKIKLSLALYASNSTMGMAKDPADFHNHENVFYTGPEGDPSIAGDNKEWKGMARYVVDKSVVTGTDFVTDFTTGHGRKFFRNGTIVRDTDWHNRGIQDIMPTWRWWVRDLVGSRIQAEYDFDTAYYGGNSLRLFGNLEKNSINNLMLYSTKLNVTNSSKLNLTYKNTNNVDMKISLSFEEDYKNGNLTYLDLPAHGEKWETATIDLSEYSGKTIHSIGIVVANSEQTKANINIGRLEISSNRESLLDGPKNIEVYEQLEHDSRKSEARIKWDKVDDANYYEVYQENADGKLKLLGVTRNEVFYADNITRNDENAFEDNTTNIIVKTVNNAKQTGHGEEGVFTWSLDLDASEKADHDDAINVALNATVTRVSHENDAEPANKAFDGTAKGNSKWASTNRRSGFLEMKLANGPATVKRWRVEHAEYGGEASNMNTVDFSLSYKNEENEWVKVKHIKDNKAAVTDIILDEPVTAEEWRLDVNNAGTSPWQAVRIYEWQMFETDTLPLPKNLLPSQVVSTKNSKNIGHLDFNYVPEELEIKIYDRIDATEPIDVIEGYQLGEKEDKNLFGKTLKSSELNFSKYEVNDSGYARLFYTVTPKFSLESSKNSINIKLTNKESTLIHVKNQHGSGVNSTFDIISEDGEVISTGGTSDSGVKISLYPGKYEVKITQVPNGHKYEEVYEIEVIEGDQNDNFLTVELLESYTKLGKMIFDSKQLKASLYTKDSFEAMLTMSDEANGVYKDSTSTDDDYQKTLEKLKNSIDALVKLDWSGVERHLNYQTILDETLFEPIELQAYKESVNNAESMMKQRNQIEINEIVETLDNELNSLKIMDGNNDLTGINKLLEEIEEIEISNYTEKSVEMLQSQVEKARSIVADSMTNRVSQTEIYDHYFELQDSKNNLELYIDTNKLETKLLEANAIETEKYTETSLEALREVMLQASEIIERANEDITSVNQKDIDNLVVALEEALQSLEVKLDVKKLEAIIMKVKAVDKTVYTQESYELMNKVLSRAETLISRIIENETVTQTEIDAMVKELEFSMKSLEEVESTDNGQEKPQEPQKPNPEQPEPKDPNVGEGGQTDPEDSKNNTEDGNNSVNAGSTDKTEKLPSTGMNSTMSIVIPSGLLVGLGYAIIRLNRKKTVE